MKFIIATKQHMSQVFTDAGVVPVTVLSCGPNVVTQIKTKEKDGYEAVQVSAGVRKEKNIAKAQKGHAKGLGNFATAAEFNPAKIEHKVGDAISLEIFKPGDTVQVSAISKGKGFQGVVKRHGFHGGPRSHGQKHSEREPGSISGGLRTGPRPGKRMAGRMGADRVTVRNLRIVEVHPTTNTILVSGAVPGRRGTTVELRTK